MRTDWQRCRRFGDMADRLVMHILAVSGASAGFIDASTPRGRPRAACLALSALTKRCSRSRSGARMLDIFADNICARALIAAQVVCETSKKLVNLDEL